MGVERMGGVREDDAKVCGSRGCVCACVRAWAWVMMIGGVGGRRKETIMSAKDATPVCVCVCDTVCVRADPTRNETGRRLNASAISTVLVREAGTPVVDGVELTSRVTLLH